MCFSIIVDQSITALQEHNSPGASSTPAPVIDPSLDSKSDTPASHQHSDSKSVSLEITEAAVQAVIESEKRREREQEEARDAAQKQDEADRDGDGQEHEDNPGEEQMILDELLTQARLSRFSPSPFILADNVAGIFGFAMTFTYIPLK